MSRLPLALAWLLASASTVAAQTPALTQEQYTRLMSSALDNLLERLQRQPRQPVLFSANLFFAHGAAIAAVPTETLRLYVDALREAGARRIEINLAIAPWRDGRSDLLAKYDAVIAHIRRSGLQLAINPAYNQTTDAGGFDAWTSAALRAYPEIARRYEPEQFVVVHEPTTQAGRMGEEVRPRRWAEFARAAARAIKASAPSTRCGVGVLYSERSYLDAFLAIEELDTVSLDIYSLRPLPSYTEMIQAARGRGKAVYVEETWRTPYLDPAEPKPETLDEFAARGIGNAAFEPLDVKWLEALALYASVMGLEAFTPFWTQTFFLYVDDGCDGALDPIYNRRVIEAIQRGARTHSFETYRRLASELGAGSEER